MPTTLSGSGTKTDPYLIKDKGDFQKIDPDQSGLYYKLTIDINLNGNPWTEVDLYDNYLNMSDHKIEKVEIGLGQKMFKNGTIYADDAVVDNNGSILVPAKDGYLLDILGNAALGILENINLERIGISVAEFDFRDVAFKSITGYRCYFYIEFGEQHPETFFTGHFRAKDGDQDHWTDDWNSVSPFIDCKFDFKGTLYPASHDVNDYHYIATNDDDTYSAQIQYPHYMFNRCYMRGTLNMEKMPGSSGTNRFYVTDWGINNSIIDFESDRPTTIQAMAASPRWWGPDLTLIVTRPTSNNPNGKVFSIQNVVAGRSVYVANPKQLDPDELINLGFKLEKIGD